MAEIDYPKLKQKFETDKEAIDFLNGYLRSLSLSYVPEDIAIDIKGEASAQVIFDIYLKRIDLHTNDIRNETNKYVGAKLLSYLEYKAKNKEL